MKVRPSVKPRCNDCKRIVRKGVRRIICAKHRRHNQRQG